MTCLIRIHLAPLSRLEEDGVVTDCEIKTEEPEDTLDFDFFSTGDHEFILCRECERPNHLG